MTYTTCNERDDKKRDSYFDLKYKNRFYWLHGHRCTVLTKIWLIGNIYCESMIIFQNKEWQDLLQKYR